MQQVSPALFDSFGKVGYQGICQFSQKLIRHVYHAEDAQHLFKQCCSSLLQTGEEFNVLEFHNLVFHLTNQNPLSVSTLLVEVFDEVTREIHDKLNNNITMEIFVTTYNNYLANSLILSKYLSYYDSKVTIGGSDKYSFVGLVRKYMFYRNVINAKYDYQGQPTYMYAILRNQIENSNLSQEENINLIKQLFKMYSFYRNMSNSLKNNNDLFDVNSDKVFLESLGTNQTFVRTIAYYIHNTIKQTKSDKDKGFESITNLVNLISVHFGERDLFNMYYEKLLEMRLLENSSNVDVEMSIINNFTRPKDNKFIQNMLYKIEDVKSMESNDKMLHTKVKIQLTDEKYGKKIDVTKLNIKKLSAKVFRKHAWEASKSGIENNMTVPLDVAPYIDIYNQYYKIKYPYRKLEWNFNVGTGVIKIKLGNKNYNLQLNIPEMYLLLQFNISKQFTAIELASNLGLPMSQIGKILNTLLKAKILKREQGKQPTDPTMLIFLNNEFYNDKDNISLIGVQVQEDKPVDKLAVLKKNVISNLSNQETFQGLFDKVKSSVTFPFSEQQLKMCIALCKSEGKVQEADDGTLSIVKST